MTDAQASTIAEPQAAAHTAPRVRVLLVDDEDVVRGMVARMLTGHGFHVLTASDGDVALEMLERCEVDVVVSDVSMRRLSGVDLVRTIASRWPHLRKLLVTGCVDALPDVPAGVPVVNKPFLPHELALRIRELLRAAP
jgi:DNA-binding response OmpR family regulator